MAQKVFKGFIQVTEAQLPASPEAGYIYFVRTTTGSSKEDGYVLFNGRKYGTATEAIADFQDQLDALDGRVDVLEAVSADTRLDTIEADYLTSTDKTELEGEIGTLSGRVDTIEEDYLKAADKTELEGEIGTVSGRVDAIEDELTGITADIEALEAISADTRLDALEAISGNVHTHDNKSVLDGISAEDVEAWDAAEDNAIAAASAYTDQKYDSAVTASEVVLSAYTGESATAGYLKTYEIFQGGDSLGKIDIPKDLVVTSGEVVTVDNVKYLRLYIANDPEHPVDIAVSDLAHVYTEGSGITITENDVIEAKVVAQNGLSVDGDGIKLAVATSAQTGAMAAADKEKLDTIAASAQTNVIEGVQVNGVDLTPDGNKKVNVEFAVLPTTAFTGSNNGVEVTVAQNESGITGVTVVAPDFGALSGRVDALEAISAETRIGALETISADTRLDAIEADYLKAADLTGITADIEALSAVSAETRIGALEAISADTRLTQAETDIDNLELSAHTHENKDVLDTISSADTEAWSAALQEVVSGSTGVNVSAKSNGVQTISLNISQATGNTITEVSDGLFAAIYYEGDDSEQ